MYGYEEPPSWFDTQTHAPLHHELGTRDQANIVHLDAYEELVWVGTQRGRLLSYLVNLADGHSAYSRFNVDTVEERIIDVITNREGILSLTRSNVLFNTRGGVGHQLLSQKSLSRMTATGILSALEQFPHNPLQLAVGTDISRTLYYVDSLSGDLTAFFDLPHSVSKIHCCRDAPLMAIGGTNGQLTMVDGRMPRIVASNSALLAHPSEVTSISSSGTYIVTTGKRMAGQTVAPDVFLKIFDTRNLRQPIPVSFPNGVVKASIGAPSAAAAAAGALTLSVLCSHGVWQQGDLYPSATGLKNVEIFQTACFQPHSPDLEPTVVDWSLRGDVGAMLDSAGVVHFWGHSQSLDQEYPYRVNPGEPGSLLLPPRHPVMPCYPNVLSGANWDVALDTLARTRVYADTVREGTWLNWMEHMTVEDEATFYSGKATPFRQAVPVLDALVADPSGVVYGSLVARARAGQNRQSPQRQRPKPGAPPKTAELDPLDDEQPSTGVPKRWRFTPVDYSVNHSVFPFGLYNKAATAGLENGQGNLDCLNPVLQCLYNLAPLKHALKAHVCDSETCLGCELGFLFHMMDEARFSRTKVCQPVRISRLWKRLESGPLSIPALMRRIVLILHSEWPLIGPDSPDLLQRLFGPADATHCKCNLDDSVSGRADTEAALVFLEPMGQQLPARVYVDLDSGSVSLEEPQGTSFRVHDLVSGVFNVAPGGTTPTPRNQQGAGHNVAIVSVMDDFDTSHGLSGAKGQPTGSGNRSRAPSLLPSPLASSALPHRPTVVEELNESRAGAASVPPPVEASEWLLLNDFVVTRSSLEEATESGASWRKPVLGMYVNKQLLPHAEVHAGASPITLEMFLKDENLARKKQKSYKFTPLSEEEIQSVLRGEFTVALDTEFVSVGLAAIEIREDGSREVGKPGDMAIGRVSVLRTDGRPFIDHYIAMDESQVKDYVTRFSGIRPGDLDPATSVHWLTSSKSIYQKLRFLVDCGCKFVGHGLHTDFRIINLWISANSVIDTVELFHSPGQRFLSLKFLANRLLEKSIQGDVHCSIEDAKTALDIYRVHQKLKEEGTVEQTIKTLYESGRTTGWK